MQFLEDSASMMVHILHSGWIQKGSHDQNSEKSSPQSQDRVPAQVPDYGSKQIC